MTKKISILAIIFSGILSENLYAETKNVKNTGTVGSEVVNVQGYINKRNVLNPNTYDDLNPLITNKAVDEESHINPKYGWNATPKGDIFAYTLTDNKGNLIAKGINCLDENKDGEGDTKTFKGNEYCSTTKQIEKDQPGNDGSCKAKDADGNEYALTIPYGYKCENSYIIPDGYVKKEGSGDYKGYFYRYWMSGTEAEKFCEPAFRSIGCWSPAYPIIAYNGFTGFNIPNTEAGAELAKTAFGTREPGGEVFNDDVAMKNIKNAYRTNNDYRMGVKVTAVTETDSAGKAVPKGEYHTNSDANLTVRKWNIVSKGLDPDFNYSELSSTGGNEISDINNLSMTSKVVEGDVLPCGMFQYVASAPAGVKKTGIRGVECSSGYVRVTQDKKENNSSPISYTLSGPLYTKYKIKLPTGNGTFESSSTHDLKVRACAKCESVANNCKEIIRNLVVQGDGQTKITDLCQLMEALRSAKTYNLYGGRGTYTTGSTGMSCSTNDCLGKLDDILLNDAEIRTALTVTGDCAKKLQN